MSETKRKKKVAVIRYGYVGKGVYDFFKDEAGNDVVAFCYVPA